MLQGSKLLHRLLQLQVGGQQFLRLQIASVRGGRFVGELLAFDHRNDLVVGVHLDQIQIGRWLPVDCGRIMVNRQIVISEQLVVGTWVVVWMVSV